MSGFEHRHAAHCESGTVAALLRHRGLNLSEPMVFGIGGGLFFLHIPWLRMGGIPLTSYRDAPRAIIKNIGKRLGIRWHQFRYRRPAVAMRELDENLARGQALGVQTGIYWLPYFPVELRFHFNGHNLVVYGKQDNDYLISDPVADVPTICAAPDLQRARFAKGVFAPRGLMYYPENVPSNPDLHAPVREAIRVTARRMTDTPIPFMGARGITWLANRLERWPEKLGPEMARKWVGSMIRMQEEIGTGGAGFRYIYSAFLQEAGDLLGSAALRDCAMDLTTTGDLWRNFAVQGALLVKQRQDGGDTYSKLANLLRDIGGREREIFARLKTAV